MSMLTHRAVPTTANHQSPASVAAELVRHVRSSRALASMLPSLLSSGLMTLVITGVMHLTWDGLVPAFGHLWMESWFTAWPIAFPVAYILGPVMNRVAAAISAPAFDAETRPGLGCSDIVDASARVTARNGFSVLRNVRSPQDLGGV